MPYQEFDCSPIEEDCVQVQRDVDYMPAMRAEAERMIVMLNSKFKDKPVNSSFKIKSRNHDFGDYLEIVFSYLSQDVDYLSHVEDNYPVTWQDDAFVPFGS